jgi:SPP1 family predicted phage head-tail adaptor
MPTAQNSLYAGKLRQRIKIVQPNVTQDASGGWTIDDASPIAIVWASVEMLSGRELSAAQQLVSEVSHKITIRWMRGIRASQQVWFNDAEGLNRTFKIQAVQNPDERNKMLFLLCIERDDSKSTN